MSDPIPTTLDPKLVAWDDFLQTSQEGDTHTYHRGHLAFDRDALTSGLGEGMCMGLDVRAKAVLSASSNGFVALSQKKMDDGWFEYIARRTKKPYREGE